MHFRMISIAPLANFVGMKLLTCLDRLLLVLHCSLLLTFLPVILKPMAKRNHSLPNLKPMLRYWPLAPIRSPVRTNCSDYSEPSPAPLKQPAPTTGMKLLTCLGRLLLVLHCSSLQMLPRAILKPKAKMYRARLNLKLMQRYWHPVPSLSPD